MKNRNWFAAGALMIMTFLSGVGFSIQLYDHTSTGWIDSAFLGTAVVAVIFAVTNRHGVNELDGGLALGVVLSVVFVSMFRYHDGIALGLADSLYRIVAVVMATVIVHRMHRQWNT